MMAKMNDKNQDGDEDEDETSVDECASSAEEVLKDLRNTRVQYNKMRSLKELDEALMAITAPIENDRYQKNLPNPYGWLFETEDEKEEEEDDDSSSSFSSDDESDDDDGELGLGNMKDSEHAKRLVDVNGDDEKGEETTNAFHKVVVSAPGLQVLAAVSDLESKHNGGDLELILDVDVSAKTDTVPGNEESLQYPLSARDGNKQKETEPVDIPTIVTEMSNGSLEEAESLKEGIEQVLDEDAGKENRLIHDDDELKKAQDADPTADDEDEKEQEDQDQLRTADEAEQQVEVEVSDQGQTHIVVVVPAEYKPPEDGDEEEGIEIPLDLSTPETPTACKSLFSMSCLDNSVKTTASAASPTKTETTEISLALEGHNAENVPPQVGEKIEHLLEASEDNKRQPGQRRPISSFRKRLSLRKFSKKKKKNASTASPRSKVNENGQNGIMPATSSPRKKNGFLKKLVPGRRGGAKKQGILVGCE